MLGAIFLTLAVLLIGGVLGSFNARRLDGNRRLVSHTHEVVQSLETLLSTLKDAETGQRGYLLYGDERFLEPYQSALNSVTAARQHLTSLVADNPGQTARLLALGSKIDVKLGELKGTIDLLRAGDRAAAVTIVAGGSGKAVMDDLRRDVAEMQAVETALLDSRERETDASYRATVASIVLATIVGVVLIGIVSYSFQRNLAREQHAARILAEEKERLRTTLASIGDAVISTDPAGDVVYLNPLAESLTGWTNEQAAGVPLSRVFNIVNESTRLPVENPALRALSDGVVVGLANHTVLIARDGTERPIDDSAAPVRGADGAITGCVLVFRDITARRRAELQLRERDEQFRRTLSEVAIPTLLHADDGEVLLVNRAWTDGSGYQHADIPTIKEWTARAYGERHAVVDDYIDTLFASDVRVDNGEWEINTASSEKRLWHFFTTPVGRDSGGRRLIVSNAIDVTEQRRDEEELRRLAAELSEADRRKDEFLATLAHELRNPLAPIRTGLQVLQRSRGDGSENDHVHEMMTRQTDQLVRLVDDLMDVSRITRGKLELRKDLVELATVLHMAVETARPIVESKGHQLTVTLPPTPVFVDADMTRLGQVFANLLNNAAKYSEPGGHIRITVERQDGEILTRVTDNGIGIPPHMLPTIFDMFAQVDRTLEKSQGGLGIGLTLAKSLATMHGGALEAHSDGPGHGSEFVVRLPAALAVIPDSRATAESKDTMHASVQRRILVADDNEDSVSMMEMLLSGFGHDVRTANDGLDAVRKAGEFEPDVVILDIGMPRLNGYEACRRIRALPALEKAVMIALSGWGQEEDKRRSEEAGFHYHVVKPVDPAALMQLLSQLKPPTA